MAQVVNVRLSRGDASPWGFRLQGGKDFGQPLLVQKVNGGSVSERAGLQVGDELIRVNGVDVQDMRHKEAQDTIVHAGNNIEMTVQRGGMSTWKPQVTAIGSVPSPGGAPSPLPVTKTSLAAKPSSTPIPSGHNVSPRPFGGASTPQLNGGGDVKALVNKQYNSPIGVYSEQNIAETLSAQTEVLKTGALGVNFMKNERSYDSQKSEVFKMLQEVDQEPRDVEPESVVPNLPLGGFPASSGLRHVAPPEALPAASSPTPGNPLPPGQNICADCERLIVGVFVRIKDKNLHVECFKCATCGSSLKNVGYYTINNKLYCDIHAKMVARQNPPAPNLDPVTIPPGGRIPSGVISASLPTSQPTQPPKVARLPSSVQAPSTPPTVSFPPSLPTPGPLSPQPGTLAPLPFHTPNAPAPKPFGSVTAPSAQPSAPYTPPAPFSNIGAPKPQTAENLNPVIWPPNQTQVSASEHSRISNSRQAEIESQINRKKMSICSQEVSNISEKLSVRGACSSISEAQSDRPTSPLPDRELEMIVRKNVMAAAHSQDRRSSKRSTSTSMSKTTSFEQQKTVVKTSSSEQQKAETEMCRRLLSRGLSPQRSDSPEILDISSKPHEIKSLLPPACVVRPITPQQHVVFPPELPEGMMCRSRSPSPRPPSGRTKKSPKEPVEKGTPPSFVGLPVVTPKPGPAIDCKLEEIERSAVPASVPIVTVTAETDSNASQQTHGTVKEKTESVESKTSTKITSRAVEEKSKSATEIYNEKVESELSKTKKQQEMPIQERLYTKEEVEKIVKKEVQKVFLKQEEVPKVEKPPELSIDDLPAPILEIGPMARALSTASNRPFTPAPFPKAPELSLRPNEPKEAPKQIKPLEKYVPVPEPSEPYFPPPPPPPDSENKDERTARALREVGCRSPMTEALTVAPERSYSPLPTTAKVDVSCLSSMKCEKTESCSKSCEKSVIKSVRPPLTIEGTASAFKPTGNGNGSLIPKSTPLVYIPHMKAENPEPRMGERYGIDRSAVAQGGKMKKMVADFENYEISRSQMQYAEIDDAEQAALKSTDVQYGCAVAMNPPPKATAQVHKTAPSGLSSQQLLPCYQVFLGDIPTRINRSISPVPPHPIKAPSMEPRPMPTPPNLIQRSRTPVYATPMTTKCTEDPKTCTSKQVCSRSDCVAKQAQTSSSTSSQSSKTVSQTSVRSSVVSSRSARTTSPLAGKPSTVSNAGKQTFKPDIPARSLSPSWKADYVRSVQNLSPITVRLPSPVPPPTKPKGELTQTTTANVTVKNTKQKTTTASQRLATTQSTRPPVGPCGTSKGCGTPPGSPTGRRSPIGPCGTSKGCGTPPPSPTGRRSPAGERVNELYHSMMQMGSMRSEDSRGWDSNNKENITASVVQGSKTAMAYSTKTTSSATTYENRSSAQKNQLVCILKKTMSGADTNNRTLSSIGNQPKRTPLTPATLPTNVTSWSATPLPPNLPLPRNCGVNPSSSGANAGGAGGLGGGRSSIAGSTAPRRGRGVLNAAVPAGGRVPLCGHCNNQIRGPFITALGKIWCPEHFVCVNPKCKRPLQDIGFVEEDDGLYCEFCFEQYLAPCCDKCRAKIKGDCLNAIGKHFHPECFKCSYCEKLFGNNPFFLEDGLPYCENDWNELFTTKCFSCGFPIEAGDRWVEALSNNYHSQCFNCTMCKKNLEGQSFFAKGGRPFCKTHAR